MSHKYLTALFSALALTMSAACAAEEKQVMPTDPAQQTPEQIIAEAETVHPAGLYILATKLMAEGRMDDAVRWFYIGQLRYRFLLAAQPERLADNQPLFSALSESVGRPLNEYAFGDVDAAVAHIDAALAWDAAHANGVTSKERHAQELAQVRAGLQKLRDDMIAGKNEIRETRTRNGLVNR